MFCIIQRRLLSNVSPSPLKISFMELALVQLNFKTEFNLRVRMTFKHILVLMPLPLTDCRMRCDAGITVSSYLHEAPMPFSCTGVPERLETQTTTSQLSLDPKKVFYTRLEGCQPQAISSRHLAASPGTKEERNLISTQKPLNKWKTFLQSMKQQGND